MYIQLTTRCNMTCQHCCYACTEKGEDMALNTFRAALALDDIYALGGGEPTIHPLFWQFLGEAIASSDENGVWLATNGSMTETAIALAKMAKKGVIGCDLSLDDFHDEIDERVIEAFDKPEKPYNYYDHYYEDRTDARGVRTNNEPAKAGRCDWGKDDCCPCSELFVKPNGDIHVCGCEDAPKIGDVFSGIEWDGEHGCHKESLEVA